VNDNKRKATTRESELQVQQLQEAVEANRSMIVRTKALIAKLTELLLRPGRSPSFPA